MEPFPACISGGGFSPASFFDNRQTPTSIFFSASLIAMTSLFER